MLGLSRKTDYALLLVTALARQGSGFVSLRSLAETYRLPYRFASAIVGELVKAGILESREGLKGGYRLAKDPDAITVTEVLSATEGTTALVACLDPAKDYACPQKTWCASRAGMPAVQRIVREALATHTIADLVAAASASPKAHA